MSELPPRIRELFTALDHAGEPSPDAISGIHGGEAGREELGTRVRFTLRIAEQRLLEVRYRAYGCPHTLATCEWLARSLEGRRIDALAVGAPTEWADHLGVPAVKLGRLLVIEDALQAALTQL
ncbi:MAG TPA: iron-sulfur cluster assembly scaffold protein [Steroidobacteraceae bacterium]